MGWNRVREVGRALFHRQSFMATATLSAMSGARDAPCLMVFCKAAEHLLGQPLALHVFVEDVGAEQILDRYFPEVDALELMVGSGDGGDGLLTNVRCGHSSRVSWGTAESTPMHPWRLSRGEEGSTACRFRAWYGSAPRIGVCHISRDAIGQTI